MEFCSQSLNESVKYLSNELQENKSKTMKIWCYYIYCELFTEIIECVHYLHTEEI